MPKLDNYEQEVDALIGDRIRARRSELGMSQAELATLIGMSFQQVQKYERGSNRIASSILLRVAEAMDCPAGYFLEIGKSKKTKKRATPASAADREAALLFQRFRQIKSAKVRSRIALFVNALIREAESAGPAKALKPRASAASKRKAKPAKPKAKPTRTARK